MKANYSKKKSKIRKSNADRKNYTMENEIKNIISNALWMQESGRKKEDIINVTFEKLKAVLPQANVIKSVCDCGESVDKEYNDCCSYQCWKKKYD